MLPTNTPIRNIPITAASAKNPVKNSSIMASFLPLNYNFRYHLRRLPINNDRAWLEPEKRIPGVPEKQRFPEKFDVFHR